MLVAELMARKLFQPQESSVKAGIQRTKKLEGGGRWESTLSTGGGVETQSPGFGL